MNGNNDDGDGYVAVDVFSQFKNDQASLCKSYRNHLETKIINMENGIKWSVYMASSLITIVLIIVNWYLNVVIS